MYTKKVLYQLVLFSATILHLGFSLIEKSRLIYLKIVCFFCSLISDINLMNFEVYLVECLVDFYFFMK